MGAIYDYKLTHILERVTSFLLAPYTFPHTTYRVLILSKQAKIELKRQERVNKELIKS